MSALRLSTCLETPDPILSEKEEEEEELVLMLLLFLSSSLAVQRTICPTQKEPQKKVQKSFFVKIIKLCMIELLVESHNRVFSFDPLVQMNSFPLIAPLVWLSKAKVSRK